MNHGLYWFRCDNNPQIIAELDEILNILKKIKLTKIQLETISNNYNYFKHVFFCGKSVQNINSRRIDIPSYVHMEIEFLILGFPIDMAQMMPLILILLAVYKDFNGNMQFLNDILIKDYLSIDNSEFYDEFYKSSFYSSFKKEYFYRIFFSDKFDKKFFHELKQVRSYLITKLLDNDNKKIIVSLSSACMRFINFKEFKEKIRPLYKSIHNIYHSTYKTIGNNILKPYSYVPLLSIEDLTIKLFQPINQELINIRRRNYPTNEKNIISNFLLFSLYNIENYGNTNTPLAISLFNNINDYFLESNSADNINGIFLFITKIFNHSQVKKILYKNICANINSKKREILFKAYFNFFILNKNPDFIENNISFFLDIFSELNKKGYQFKKILQYFINNIIGNPFYIRNFDVQFHLFDLFTMKRSILTIIEDLFCPVKEKIEIFALVFYNLLAQYVDRLGRHINHEVFLTPLFGTQQQPKDYFYKYYLENQSEKSELNPIKYIIEYQKKIFDNIITHQIKEKCIIGEIGTNYSLFYLTFIGNIINSNDFLANCNLINQIKYLCIKDKISVKGYKFSKLFDRYIEEIALKIFPHRKLGEVCESLLIDIDDLDKGYIEFVFEYYILISNDKTKVIILDDDYFSILMEALSSPRNSESASYILKKMDDNGIQYKSFYSYSKTLEVYEDRNIYKLDLESERSNPKDIIKKFPMLNYFVEFISYKEVNYFEILFKKLNLDSYENDFIKALDFTSLQGNSKNKFLDETDPSMRSLSQKFCEDLKKIFEVFMINCKEIHPIFMENIYTSFDFSSESPTNKAILTFIVVTVITYLSSAEFFGTDSDSPEILRHLISCLLIEIKRISPNMIPEENFRDYQNRLFGNIIIDRNGAHVREFTCTGVLGSRMTNFIRSYHKEFYEKYFPFIWR